MLVQPAIHLYQDLVDHLRVGSIQNVVGCSKDLLVNKDKGVHWLGVKKYQRILFAICFPSHRDNRELPILGMIFPVFRWECTVLLGFRTVARRRGVDHRGRRIITRIDGRRKTWGGELEIFRCRWA
jgi:hypothetical protein